VDTRCHKVRDDAFSILTPEACYFAGLLATDGNLPSKTNKIKIALKAIDEYTLQALAKFIGFGGSFSYRTMSATEGRGLYVEMSFSSKKIREDLCHHFGIVPNKSGCMPSPKLTGTDLVLAYMVGLIEGDGSVKYDAETQKIEKISFFSASRPLVEWFSEHMRQLTGSEANIHRHAGNANKNYFGIHCTGIFAEQFFGILQGTSVGTMKRKWLPPACRYVIEQAT
jgi:hypothetical protein